MKPLHVLVLAALVSVLTSVLTVKVLSAGDDVPGAAGVRGDGDSALDEIKREQSMLRQSLEKLESSTRLSATPSSQRAHAVDAGTSLSADDVRAIVARALEDRDARDSMRAADPGSVAMAMHRLLDPNLTDEERVELWAILAQAGTIDAVVAEYEKRAAAAPQDSMAQADLGFAYLQKMRHSDDGAEKGAWGKKGSDTYAKALELDDANWDARFAQAQHFFYADMPGDALHHLNILRSQQKSRRAEARHADAFVFLGNVYLEQGNPAEAKSVWKEGLALFPGNERLAALVQAVE